MATKKATSTKKPTTRKKASAVRSKKSKSQTSAVRSFRVSKPDTPFMTFSITRQTVYWLVLGLIVIVFGFWINKLQSDISDIYDSIEQNMILNDYTPVKKR